MTLTNKTDTSGLSDILNEAVNLDAEVTPTPELENPTQINGQQLEIIDLASQFENVLSMGAMAANKFAPALAQLYTPEVIRDLAEKIAAVCRKRKWLANGFMGDNTPEIALLGTVAMLGYSTYQIIELEKFKKAKQEAAQNVGSE